jgi:hypothetical protein
LRRNVAGEAEELYVQILYCRADAKSLNLNLIHYFLDMAGLSLEAGTQLGKSGNTYKPLT